MKIKDLYFEPIIEKAISFNNKIYFMANNYNMLFSIDIESGQYDSVGQLLYENTSAYGLVGSIIRVENELILGGVNAKNNYKFLIDTGNIICLKNSEFGRDVDSLICITDWDGEVNLVTVPVHGKRINIYSYNDLKLKRTFEITDEYIEKVGCNYKTLCVSKASYLSNSVFFPSFEKGLLFEITKSNLLIHIIDNCENGIINFEGVENIGCCICNNNKIVIYDLVEKKVKKYFDLDIDITQFRKQVVIGSKIIFFSLYNNSIITFDIYSYELGLGTINQYFNINQSEKIIFLIRDDKYLFFKDSEVLVIYEIETQKYKKTILKCNCGQIGNTIYKTLLSRKNEIIYEHDKWCKLPLLFDIVMNN